MNAEFANSVLTPTAVGKGIACFAISTNDTAKIRVHLNKKIKSISTQDKDKEKLPILEEVN